MKAFTTIAVVGAGQMGAGIAQVCAMASTQENGPQKVLLYDSQADALARAESGIQTSLGKLVGKGQISEDQHQNVFTILHPVQDINALAGADLVIEAIVEQEAAKISLLQQLDTLLNPEAILASNTSSISITRLAAVTQRASQVIGLHFMNPVPLMALVELIPGAQTSDETVEAMHALVRFLGKTAVESKDFPGFIANRVLMPLLNEAMFAVFEGVGSVEAVDTVMKLGMKHPMGPLALADFIGLDTVLSIMQVLHEGFGDARFRPCPLLKQYVDAGYLGKKSGRGFYSYNSN